MHRPTIALCILAAVVLASAPLLATPVYTVALDNGTEWVSLYRPVIADDDENAVLLLTEWGNWIRLDRAQIANFEIDIPGNIDAELRDDGAIVLGSVANDAALTDAEGQSLDPATQLMQYMRERDANRPDYSVDQFVEPGEAGTGGLPVSGLGEAPGQSYGSGTTSFPVQSGGADPVEPGEID